MPKKKISELPAGGALNGTELVPIVQTGTTKRITAQDIANLGNASGVEGSGTINRLPKFTASSTIGNSAFFDDGTNQGTETTTAINRFIMSANASIAKIFSFRSGNLPRWAFRVDGTESGANAGADLAIRRYNDAGTFIDSPLFIKRSTGNIGLGTTSPNVELALFNATTPRFHLQNTASGTGTTDGFQLALAGSDTYLYNWENGATIFGTNGAEKMRITSAGNVGIGTSTPAYPLDIVSSNTRLRIKDNGTGSSIIDIEGGSGSFYIGADNSTGSFFGGAAYAGTIFRQSAYPIALWTNNAERMRIASGGNVLIGTTTDAGYKLDVNGTARVRGRISTIGGTSNDVYTQYTTIADITNTNDYVLRFNNNAGTQIGYIGVISSGGVFQYNNSNGHNFTGAATFANRVNIGNPVAAAVAVASTHKVTISIGGVTYYLLATNV